MRRKASPLREMRESKGIKQDELAKELNIDRSTYAKIEADPEIYSIRIADKIAKRFDVPLEFLFSHFLRSSPLPSECLLKHIYSDQESLGGYDAVVTLEDMKDRGIILDDELFFRSSGND